VGRDRGLRGASHGGEERAIFKLLTTDTPLQIDTLAETTKLSITQLTTALLTLEMRELIRALPGKCFVRKM